jgi:hypothetical protein
MLLTKEIGRRPLYRFDHDKRNKEIIEEVTGKEMVRPT